MIEITQSGKNPLVIENPVMPAAGTFGFDGSTYRDLVDLSKLGALVTNPVTWKARHPAHGPRVVPLPSGVLIHTGLPNPGVNRVVRQYGKRWARSLAPVIVHLVGTTPGDVARAAQVLDRVEGVAGIELGLHDQATPDDVAALLNVIEADTLLPVLVRVPLYNAVALATAAQDFGAGGVVVAAPPRGTTRDPATGMLIGGRVYGPWLKPQALRAVGQVARVVDVPVIGCGGIHSPDDARDMIEAGAAAVQIDTLIWTQPHLLEVIARNLGGLELTRATGALADEWEPGMGETMRRAREELFAPDEGARIERPQPPDQSIAPPANLPEEDLL